MTLSTKTWLPVLSSGVTAPSGKKKKESVHSGRLVMRCKQRVVLIRWLKGVCDDPTDSGFNVQAWFISGAAALKRSLSISILHLRNQKHNIESDLRRKRCSEWTLVLLILSSSPDGHDGWRTCSLWPTVIKWSKKRIQSTWNCWDVDSTRRASNTWDLLSADRCGDQNQSSSTTAGQLSGSRLNMFLRIVEARQYFHCLLNQNLFWPISLFDTRCSGGWGFKSHRTPEPDLIKHLHHHRGKQSAGSAFGVCTSLQLHASCVDTGSEARPDDTSQDSEQEVRSDRWSHWCQRCSASQIPLDQHHRWIRGSASAQASLA